MEYLGKFWIFGEILNKSTFFISPTPQQQSASQWKPVNTRSSALYHLHLCISILVQVFLYLYLCICNCFCVFVIAFVYLYLCIWIFEFKYFHSMKQQSISQWKLVNTRSSALYLSQVFHQISPQLVSKSWLVLHFISLERFILCFYRIYGKILGFSRTVNLRNSCWPAAYHINTFHTEVFCNFPKLWKWYFQYHANISMKNVISAHIGILTIQNRTI